MASNPETRRGSPFVLWGTGIAVVGLGLFLLRFLTRERISVHTAPVSYQDLIMTTPANGKVEPIDEFEAHAQTAGIVQDIYVSPMEKVRPGQLLLRMDDADAKARLASAESALQAAQLAMSEIEHGGTQDERNTYEGDLSRSKIQREQDAGSLAALEKLQAQGDASPAEVAAARHRLAMDDSNLQSIEKHSTQRYDDADRARARAAVDDAQAAVAAAQSAVAGDDIRTPIAGTVYNIPVSRYDYVPAGDNNDLIYVADLNRLQVTAYFDEPEVGNLADGQPVKITWEAKPSKVWHGHITTAPTTIITYGTRNVGECFISVDDPTSDLLPNTNVTVTVTTAQRLQVLSVPREAVHTDSAGSFVYRVINNKLVRTPVQVGIYNLTREEILSGLSEGDTVALNATTNRDLSNGLQVKPVE